MSIHLYIAPAAAGKTAYAVSRARAAASLRREVTVCVASQLQRGSWHARLAQAGGTLGARVVTFGGLYRQYLNWVGLAVTELDPPVQQRLLRMVLAQADLVYYAALRNSSGFAQMLRRLCAELKAAAITPEQFANGVRDLGSEPRLVELATLYAAYQQLLASKGWADEEELGLLALNVLRLQPELGRDCALFVVDGFDSLTTLQLAVLELLAQRAHETLITLTGSIGGERRGDVHRRFDDTRAWIEQALNVAAEPLPSAVVPSQSTLARLEGRLYTGLPGGPSDGSVELIEGADCAGEVRAALRWLKARILVDGNAPGEVALLARNVSPYRPYIQQTADELGLPVRLLDGQPLAGTPVIAALLDLLQLLAPSTGGAGPALTRRLVVEAWRSPYLDLSPAGIGPGDAEVLDNIARQGRVLGGLPQWQEAFERLVGRVEGLNREEGEDSVELADHAQVSSLWPKFQRFVEWLTPPEGNVGVRALVQWLETLIDPDGEDEVVSLRVRECVVAARGIAAEWDLEALRALKGVLRGLVWAELNLGSGDTADFAAFYRDLRAALEVSTVRLGSCAAGDAIPVADVVQARGVPFRVVAVLGLAEGEFPATLREDPLLRDADRLGLRARGLPLDLSTQSAEMGFFYEALCRPRERLLLTRPCLAEGGVPWEASPYWDEVLLATGAQPLRLTSDTPVALPQAASLPEAFESLAQLPEESPWHAWMRAREPERYARWQRTMAIQQERWTRAPRGPHNGDLQTLAGALKERYGPEHCWSASALETYRDCPHWFFVGRTLGLEARQDPEEGLDSRQLGSIYHRLLQATYETCARDDRADAESLVAALESVAQGILDAAPAREGFRETAWWEQTRREIHQTVAATLRALAVATAGHMPEAFELWFDVRVGDPTTGELRLHGIIDRLDRMADGGWCVIDYKTGGATRYAQAAAQEGRVLQLPLYALAAQALQGGEVREGYYWHIRDAQASGLRLRADPGPEQAMADALRYGLEAVGGVRAGAFLPRPPRDGCPDYCPAAAWCVRYRPAAKGQSR